MDKNKSLVVLEDKKINVSLSINYKIEDMLLDLFLVTIFVAVINNDNGEM